MIFSNLRLTIDDFTAYQPVNIFFTMTCGSLSETKPEPHRTTRHIILSLGHKSLPPTSGAMKSLPSVPHRRCGTVFLPPGYDFLQQWARHLGGLTREFWNCGAPVYRHCLPRTIFLASPGKVGLYGLRSVHWFGLQWIAHTIVWPCWNFAFGGRQYQCSNFLLTLCNNYCRHKTETALHYSFILPIYWYACTFPSHLWTQLEIYRLKM